MQLKMGNKFNVKSTREILQEENKFISDLFSKMPLPMADLENICAESDDEDSPQRKKAKSMMHNGEAKRAQTFGELHEKLSELKGQKKLTYKQKQLKKGLKNRLKKKTKREVRLMQKKFIKKDEDGDGENGVSDDSNTLLKKEENADQPKISRAKPVFNSDGNMVFSKFDFSEIGTKKKPPKVGNDPKKILQQLKDKKEKLKTLENAGEKDKIQEIKEKEIWKNVLAKASGEKVKDDPELLKRSIKRNEQQKKRSAKKWESRITGVDKAKEERQKKRQDNIAARKKDKKNNKLKKSAKKGRIIPGF